MKVGFEKRLEGGAGEATALQPGRCLGGRKRTRLKTGAASEQYDGKYGEKAPHAAQLKMNSAANASNTSQTRFMLTYQAKRLLSARGTEDHCGGRNPR
jgi:hypothetical protein